MMYSKLFVGLFLNTGVVLLLVNASVTQQLGLDVGFELALSGKYSDFTQDWFSVCIVTSLCYILDVLYDMHVTLIVGRSIIVIDHVITNV
jgi:hypothetical protein